MEEEFITKLNAEVAEVRGDNEAVHSIADSVLLEALEAVGFNALAERFRELRDDTPFWYA